MECQFAATTSLVPCRPALDEAAAASYELGDAEYAANEVEVTWVTSLLGTLVACLQWLQPMLTPGNFDALVASLLDKARFLSLTYTPMDLTWVTSLLGTLMACLQWLQPMLMPGTLLDPPAGHGNLPPVWLCHLSWTQRLMCDDCMHA